MRRVGVFLRCGIGENAYQSSVGHVGIAYFSLKKRRTVKAKFPTVYGLVVVENDTLFLRSFYLPFSRTTFARIGYELLWIAAFVFQFFRDEPKKYVGIVVWAVLVLLRLPNVYDVLFKRSYTIRIPLQQIREFTMEDDRHGYQTAVKLLLKNGRYRKLIFRKLENRAEAFADLLSQYLTAPKLV